MLDPFLVPHIPQKVRRVCTNPLCAKLLSNMNKQDLCFSCYNLSVFRRSELTAYRSSASKFLR